MKATTIRYRVAKTTDRPTMFTESIDIHRIATAPTLSKEEQRKQSREHLEHLAERRNALLTALEHSATVAEDFTATAHELADILAQIATYKTLQFLADSPNRIDNATDTCYKLLRSLPLDLAIYRQSMMGQQYSDAIDLYQTAYTDIWKYIGSTAPLSLDDTVETQTLKNGDERNRTIYQVASKSIRDYVRSWRHSADYKKLAYIIGYTDNGEQVTSTKRPTDNLEGITDQDRNNLFAKYGLTAKERQVIALVINGESTEDIAKLLAVPLRTAQHTIKRAKAKMTAPSAYAEYITAKNAERLAQSRADKHPTDSTYQTIYTQAKERTARALHDWQTAFYAESRKRG